MKTIKENIFVEEIQSLLMGKTIDFLDLDDEQLKIQISGKDIKDFLSSDVENLGTEYLKHQIEIMARELENRQRLLNDKSNTKNNSMKKTNIIETRKEMISETKCYDIDLLINNNNINIQTTSTFITGIDVVSTDWEFTDDYKLNSSEISMIENYVNLTNEYQNKTQHKKTMRIKKNE